MMKPTKYEYFPTLQIAGVARDFTSKIEITQNNEKWTATAHITSIPMETSGDATAKLRAELIRLAEQLGGAAK